MVKTEVSPNGFFLSTLWNRIAAERSILLELRECGDCCSTRAGAAADSADCGKTDCRSVYRRGAGEWLERDYGPNTHRGRFSVYQWIGRRGVSCRLDRHP
jgi:hypothetical protein